jgi:hypothetical protein
MCPLTLFQPLAHTKHSTQYGGHYADYYDDLSKWVKGPNFIIQLANQQGQTGIFPNGSKKSPHPGH